MLRKMAEEVGENRLRSALCIRRLHWLVLPPTFNQVGVRPINLGQLRGGAKDPI
jgi:hypothetical protein